MNVQRKTLLFLIIVLYFQNLSSQPYLRSGFPIIIDSLNSASAQPTIADIDKDVIEDIVISKNSPPFLLFVYNINGEVLDGWPQTVDGGTFAIASGDIDGDGYIDIISRTTKKIYAFHGDGTLFSGFPQQFATQWDNLARRKIVLYDLHHNNTLDILTASFNKVYNYHCDGSLHDGWPVSLNGMKALYPSIGDINKDGDDEIVICSYSISPDPNNNLGWLYLLNKDGAILPNWPVLYDSGYTSFSSGTLCDINNDDSMEIVIESSVEYQPFVEKTKVNIFSYNATLIRSIYNPAPDDFKGFGEVSVADFNNDGSLEFTVSDRARNNYVFDFLGNILPGWPRSIVNYFPAILADIDNDSIPELFFGQTEGTNNDTGKYHCYNTNGASLIWSPFITYGNSGGAQPIFTDMDNDGSMEMILITSLSAHFNGYALSVYTFQGAAFSQKGSPWPQLEHDRHNTYQYGYVPSDNVVGIAVAVSSVPEQFSLKQNYPNPFNPQTAIGFSLLAVGNITLKVYDVLGREIQTLLNNETMQAGKHEIQFDANGLTSGVYFYRLSVDSKFSETKKLVLMK